MKRVLETAHASPSKKKKIDENDTLLQELQLIETENKEKLLEMAQENEDKSQYDEEFLLQQQIIDQQNKMKQMIDENRKKANTKSSRPSSPVQQTSLDDKKPLTTKKTSFKESLISTYSQPENYQRGLHLMDICHNVILDDVVLEGKCLDSSVKIHFVDASCTHVDKVQCNHCLEEIMWCQHVCAILLTFCKNPQSVVYFQNFERDIVGASKTILDLIFLNTLRFKTDYLTLLDNEIKTCVDATQEVNKLKLFKSNTYQPTKTLLTKNVFNFSRLVNELEYAARENMYRLDIKVKKFQSWASQLDLGGEYVNCIYLLLRILMGIKDVSSMDVKYYNTKKEELLNEVVRISYKTTFDDISRNEILTLGDDLVKKDKDRLKDALYCWNGDFIIKVLSGDKAAIKKYKEKPEFVQSRIEYLTTTGKLQECFYLSQAAGRVDMCALMSVELNKLDLAIEYLSDVKGITQNFGTIETCFQKLFEKSLETHYDKMSTLLYIYVGNSKLMGQWPEFWSWLTHRYVEILHKINKMDLLSKIPMETGVFSNAVLLKVCNLVKNVSLSSAKSLITTLWSKTSALDHPVAELYLDLFGSSSFSNICNKARKTNKNDVDILNLLAEKVTLDNSAMKSLFKLNLNVGTIGDRLRSLVVYFKNQSQVDYLIEVFKPLCPTMDSLYHNDLLSKCEVAFEILKNDDSIENLLSIFEMYSAKILPYVVPYEIKDSDLSINCPCPGCQTIKTFQYNTRIFETDLVNPSEALQDSIRSCPKLKLEFIRESDYGYGSGIFKVYKVLTANEINSIRHYHDKIKEYTNLLISKGASDKLTKIKNPFVILEVSKVYPKNDVITYLFAGYNDLMATIGKMPVMISKLFADISKTYVADMENVFTKSNALKGAFDLLASLSKGVDPQILENLSKFFVGHDKEWNSFFKDHFLKHILDYALQKHGFGGKEIDAFVNIFAKESPEMTMEYLIKALGQDVALLERIIEVGKIWKVKKFRLTPQQVTRLTNLVTSNETYVHKVQDEEFDNKVMTLSETNPVLALELGKKRTDTLRILLKQKTYSSFHNWLKKLIVLFARAGVLKSWNGYIRDIQWSWKSKKAFAKKIAEDPALDPSKHVNIVQTNDEEVIELD